MAISPNEEIHGRRAINAQAIYRSLHHNRLARTWTGSKNANALHSIKTHRQRRTNWEQITPHSQPREPCLTDSGKPELRIVIPNYQRNRPLPTIPLLKLSNGSQIRSASAAIVSACDVSPLSDTKQPLVHTPIVSSRCSQKQRPARYLRHSIGTNVSTPDSDLWDQDNILTGSDLSSAGSHADDSASVYSKCSSRMSEGAYTSLMSLNFAGFYNYPTNAIFPVECPVAAGVFDDDASVAQNSDNWDIEPRHRLSTPGVLSKQILAPTSLIPGNVGLNLTSAQHPLRTCSDTLPTTPQCRLTPTHTATINSTSPKHMGHGRGLFVKPTVHVPNQAITRSNITQPSPCVTSPTLSEAENDLGQYLAFSFTDGIPIQWDNPVEREACIKSFDPLPPPPQKSSNRQPYSASGHSCLLRDSDAPITYPRKPSRTSVMGKRLRIEIPGKEKRMTNDFVQSLQKISPNVLKPKIAPNVAESVILSVFQNLDALDDLFAAAVVNRAFYRVYKCHELDLMKSTLRKTSPPAWEHRETCYPGHDYYDPDDLRTVRPKSEYTPTQYLQYHRRDSCILAALKSLIKQECQSFLRPEISMLLSDESMETARLDDALWRIWTFCKVFGSGKGREEDIVAQMDWLKGGVLVHQNTCSYSIFTTDAIAMSDTFVNAPECFARGNTGGLTAEELFDMMELWNCLGFLLHPIQDCRVQARQYGVYDDTDVRGGDIDGEETMLEEWDYYLLSLGLSPIVELAVAFHQSESAAFNLARRSGWIHWNAPIQGATRRNFFKEATSRVYKDRIALGYAEAPNKEAQRQPCKHRVWCHATELRERKYNGKKPLRVHRSRERSISESEDDSRDSTRPCPASYSSIGSRTLSVRSSFTVARPVSSSALGLAAADPLPAGPRYPPDRVLAQPLLPTPSPSIVASERDRRSIASSMSSNFSHAAFRSFEPVFDVPSVGLHSKFSQNFCPMAASVLGIISHSTTLNAPRLESHPMYHQHLLQRDLSQADPAEDCVDKAVHQLVAIGFTAVQAREALRRTTTRDGLRVDWAVELLLREI